MIDGVATAHACLVQPVAEGRGKCISLGDSFVWITPHNIDLVARYSKEGLVCPALVGFETLRALKQACDELSLTKADVEDVRRARLSTMCQQSSTTALRIADKALCCLDWVLVHLAVDLLEQRGHVVWGAGVCVCAGSPNAGGSAGTKFRIGD